MNIKKQQPKEELSVANRTAKCVYCIKKIFGIASKDNLQIRFTNSSKYKKMRPWKGSLCVLCRSMERKNPSKEIFMGSGKEKNGKSFVLFNSFIHAFIHLTNTVFIKGHLSESCHYYWEYSWEQARHSSCPDEAFSPAGESDIKTSNHWFASAPPNSRPHYEAKRNLV